MTVRAGRRSTTATDAALTAAKAPTVTVRTVTRYSHGMATVAGGGSNTPVRTFTSITDSNDPVSAPARIPTTVSTAGFAEDHRPQVPGAGAQRR